MAVVNLNLSLEQVLEFIENLPQEYKKAAFNKLRKEFHELMIDEVELFLHRENDFLSKKEIEKLSKLIANLLETNTSKEVIENNFKMLISFYQQLGNKYEQAIHQTQSAEKALEVKENLEDVFSLANSSLGQIKETFKSEQKLLDSLVNEIENIAELIQDIQLKFFDIPSKTSIHEILKRI